VATIGLLLLYPANKIQINQNYN